MAYTKTTWINDSPPDINAENLNKMEQGIADAQFPEGGTTGQVLKKTATGTEWGDESGGGTASDITYDNTDSGLTATDVQNAIDETVDALNTGLSSAVKSVNTETPDANGNVDIDATDIPTSSGVAIKSLTGNPLTIADALQGKALGLSVNIEPIQSGSGDPSPTNVRPISGISSVDILRTGHNIWDEQWEVGYFFDSNGVLRYSYQSTTCIMSKNFIPVVPNTTYRGITGTGRIERFALFDINGNYQRVVTVMASSYTLTVPSDTYFVKFHTELYGTTYNHDISINYPETVTTYEPYTGQTVTVALGRTVYGGTLNVIAGALVVDRAFATYNGSENWQQYSGSTSFFLDNAVSARPHNQYDNSNNSSNIAYWPKTDGEAETPNCVRFQGVDGLRLYIINSTFFTDVNSLKSYLSSTPLQICYKLATPLTFNLTPAQLNPLSSTNILTTNAEDLTVRYYATGKQGNVEGNIAFLLGQTASNASAINALSESVAPEETSPATAPHATGKYLMYQNRLYKVIASIAVGETLTVGTNIQATTIMEELLALTA